MKLAQIIHREKNITYGVTENSQSMTRLPPYARQLCSVYSTFFCSHEEERLANIQDTCFYRSYIWHQQCDAWEQQNTPFKGLLAVLDAYRGWTISLKRIITSQVYDKANMSVQFSFSVERTQCPFSQKWVFHPVSTGEWLSFTVYALQSLRLEGRSHIHCWRLLCTLLIEHLVLRVRSSQIAWNPISGQHLANRCVCVSVQVCVMEALSPHCKRYLAFQCVTSKIYAYVPEFSEGKMLL